MSTTRLNLRTTSRLFAGPARRPSRRQRGTTLVEAMAYLAILSILLGGVWRSMQSFVSTHRLESAAALLETDLRYARSLALAQDTGMRLEIQTLATGATCYVVYSGSAGACACAPQGQANGQAQCQGDGRAWRLAMQPADGAVRLLHSGRPLLFDAGKGTVTPTATIVVADRDGQAIHQVVNLMGRVRSCSPNGTAGLRSCV